MYQLIEISPGTIGLDRSDTIAEYAADLYQAGYQYAFRTIALTDSAAGVLTTEEAETILNSGMLIGLYQINRSKIEDGEQGTTDGQSAVRNASALNAPAGLPIWYNFEGYSTANVVPATLKAYLNSWAAAVIAGGYTAALYNGPQSALSGSEIGALPNFTAYWEAGAIVPTPTPRGYQVIQLNPENYIPPGIPINIDINVTQQDYSRALPSFWGK